MHEKTSTYCGFLSSENECVFGGRFEAQMFALYDIETDRFSVEYEKPEAIKALDVGDECTVFGQTGLLWFTLLKPEREFSIAVRHAVRHENEFRYATRDKYKVKVKYDGQRDEFLENIVEYFDQYKITMDDLATTVDEFSLDGFDVEKTYIEYSHPIADTFAYYVFTPIWHGHVLK